VADVQSNIEVNLDASQALAQLKALQRQLSNFHSSIAATSATAAKAQAGLQTNLINSVNATGQFRASLQEVKSTADTFTDSLEKNKFSTREYFRYAGGATKTFGKLFKSEYDTIGRVSEERLKTMQTQYIKMGRTANGAIQSIAVRPLALDMDNLATKTALAAQKQQLFGQLLKQGSTNLLNFGKNTQWAGRQLMVGFTIPLAMLGTTASKTFMELEKQAIRFKRVYGEIFSASEDADKALKDVQLLAKEFLKYGVAVEKTMSMAADAAATGKQGADLLAQVSEATRLAVLGNIEQNQALETTISLTNAFGIEADQLKKKIDFLNAVENQTVLNIEDLTIAIPKAAPVIKQLGGDVEDLAFFMTAMKEGGINASEGANALKSGLASLINPSKKAAGFLQDLGININGIVEGNKGNIKNTVVQFAQALDTLDPLNRARAIEQLFGKFQFSRLSTLFQNVTKDGTQASRTLDLAGASVEDLAILSERELAKVENATGTKFKKSLENLKVSLAPVGEQFLKAITPIVEFFGKILEKFNGLGDGSKKAIVMLVGAVGLIGPALLMTFGLIANGAANIIKLFLTMRNGFLGLGKQSNFLGNQTQYLSSQQLEAAAIAASLDQSHSRLIQTFTSEAAAANALAAAYQKANIAGSVFARTNPGMMQTGVTRKKYAKGVESVPGPKGAGDIIPAMLSPGESIIPADMTERYAPLIQGMVAGNIPGLARGIVSLGMPRTFAKTQSARLQEKTIEQNFAKSSFAGKPPTNYGHLIKPFSGRSFPIQGVGGVYRKPDGNVVVVKPVTDELSGMAEIRSNTIARDVHGLVTPKQTLSSMIDPTDPSGKRKIIVLESPYDSNFVQLPGTFSRDQYVKQLVASSLRGDKDLSPSNLSGNILVDSGAAGVFGSASGFREYATAMPSMAKQAAINVLGVKGSHARKFFAEATQPIAASLTPEKFESLVLKEIESAIPKLKGTIKSFKLSGQDVLPYEQMLARLEEGKTADWKSILEMHKKVVPGFSNGVFSVPGPKGAGDVVPAMLTPGESVISEPMTKKHGGLINSIIADNIPGYEKSLAADGINVTRAHAASDIIPGSSSYISIIQTLSQDVRNLIQQFPDVVRVVSNFVAEFPKSFQLANGKNIDLNQKLKSGATVDEFSQVYNSRDRVFHGSAQRGGLDVNNIQQDSALIDFENRVGERTVQLASTAPNKMVTDPIFAQATAEIIQEFETSTDQFSKNVGQTFKRLSQEIGQIRLQPKASQIRTGLESGDFTRKEDGNIYYGNQQVARIGSSGKQHPANPINTRGNYKTGQSLSISNATAERQSNQQLEKNTAANIVLGKSTTSATVAQDQVTKSQIDLNNALRLLTSKTKMVVGSMDKAIAVANAQVALGMRQPATTPLPPPAWATKSTGPLPKLGPKMNLHSGTERVPGSGNQDTVPAMLTPGEAVIPADMAKKYAPLVNSIIADNIPGFKTGTGGINVTGKINNMVYGTSARNRTTQLPPNPIILQGSGGSDPQIEEAQRMKTQKMMQRSSAMMMTTMMVTSALGMFGNDLAQKLAPATQALSAAMMGLQMVMGRGPWAYLALGVAAVAITLYKINEKNKEQARAQSLYIDAMSATTEKMKSIGQLTGKVGASESMSKKRSTGTLDKYLTGFDRKGQQFGSSMMESDIGKEIYKNFTVALKEDKGKALKSFGLQLGSYVADGVMTLEQAESFARSIGISLKDMTISSQVVGELRELLGPNGENLLETPLVLRTKIITEGLDVVKNTLQGLKDIVENQPIQTTKTGDEYAAQLAAQSVQQLESVQAQIDGQEKLYDKKIQELEKQRALTKDKEKQAKIDAQISELTKKQKTDTVQLRKNVANVLAEQLKALELLQREDISSARGYQTPFFESLKKQITEKYKDSDPAGAKELIERTSTMAGKFASTETKQKAQKLEVTIDTLVGGGVLGVPAATNLLKMFGDNKEQLVTTLSTAFELHDSGQLNDVSNIIFTLLGTENPESNLTIFTELTSKEGAAKFEDRANLIASLFEIQGKELNFSMLFDEKSKDPFAKLDTIIGFHNQVENLKNPLNLKVVSSILTKGLDIKAGELKDLEEFLKYIEKLPKEQQRTAIQKFVEIYQTIGDKEIVAAQEKAIAKAGGSILPDNVQNKLKESVGKTKTAAELVEPIFRAGITNTGTGGGKGDGGGGKRDTTFDDMLKKLKLFHSSVVEATGGYKELIRVMTTKKLTIPIDFDGTISKIRKLGKGKISEDYLDFIKNLTPEQLEDKKLMNKLGITTKKGKLGGLAVDKIDPKTQARVQAGMTSGNISSNYDDTIKALKEMEHRTSAINILRKRGFSEAEANNFVTSDGIALAIIEGKIKEKTFKTAQEKQRELTKATFEYNRFTKTAQMDAAESQSKQLKMARLYIQLQEKMIENEYVKERTQLEVQKGDVDYALEQIAREEYEINKSYDKQITALEEINKLKEKQNELTSARMSIASALAKGDIGAASSAMQEYRNAKIAQGARTKMEALQKAKENAIKGVTATGSDGKVYTKEDLETMSRRIDQRLVDMDNEVRVKKIELDKLTQQTTKLTKDQIDAAISTIDLAIEALGPEGAKKLLTSVFTTLDGQAEAAKLAVIDLGKEFTEFIKIMNNARIAAVGVSSDIVIPEPPRPPTQQELDAAADGPEKGKNRKESQGFGFVNPTNEEQQAAARAAELAAAEASKKKIKTSVAPVIVMNIIGQEQNNQVNNQQPKSREEREAQIAKNDIAIIDAYKNAKVAPKTPAYDPLSYLRRPYNSGGMVPKYMAMGGMVRRYMASGGLARGTDTVPAMLTPGEFVINKKATQEFGPLLSAINSPTFKTPTSSNPNFSGINSSSSVTSTNNSKTLYNYNLSVNVSNSNANPNDIARTVISQIKMIEDQRIRSS
jgi:TP901 family phage tail tape measure protein